MHKLLRTAAITACIGIGANQAYHLISRAIARSLSHVYGQAIEKGAIVTVTLRMPSHPHHHSDDE
jgi:hypothetical protein